MNGLRKFSSMLALIIMGVGSLWAEDDPLPSTPEQLARREAEAIEDFNSLCRNRDFASERCTVVQKSENMYKPSEHETMAYTALNVFRGKANFSQDIYDVTQWAAYGDRPFSESTTGRRIRGTVAGELRRMMSGSGISHCHKACMIKCASSSLLKYERAITKFSSTEEILVAGRGECTEFTSIALEFASMLGIPAISQFGRGHSFVSFNIDGTEYNAEPQTGQCEFFFREEIEQAELVRHEVALNGTIADHGRRLVASTTGLPLSGNQTPASPE